jgi:hypothetical protein
MKYTKTIILACVVIFTILTFAACSGSTAPNSGAATPPQSNNQTVTFPANDKEKTEFNASIYEIAPFDLSVELPNGWTLKERESAAGFDTDIAIQGVWSVLDIFDENGGHAGAVGYNTYEPYQGAEDVPQAIYNQIALGNNYHFDVRDSYTAIRETASGVTAAADVYYSASINNGAEKTNKGIVSYNKNLLVYVAMEFASDKITDEQVENIAKSIQLE